METKEKSIHGFHGTSFIVPALIELLLGNGIGELGGGEMVGIWKETPIVGAIHGRIPTLVRENVICLNFEKMNHIKISPVLKF